MQTPQTWTLLVRLLNRRGDIFVACRSDKTSIHRCSERFETEAGQSRHPSGAFIFSRNRGLYWIEADSPEHASWITSAQLCHFRILGEKILIQREAGRTDIGRTRILLRDRHRGYQIALVVLWTEDKRDVYLRRGGQKKHLWYSRAVLNREINAVFEQSRAAQTWSHFCWFLSRRQNVDCFEIERVSQSRHTCTRGTLLEWEIRVISCFWARLAEQTRCL